MSRPFAGARPTSELGALKQWREELRCGHKGQLIERPSSWITDALYKAACYEAMATEARAAGLPLTEALWLEKAADAIVTGIAERAA